MKRLPSTRCLVCLIFLALVGFGCKKKTALTPSLGYGFWQIGSFAEHRAPKPYEHVPDPNDKGDHYVAPEVRYLQQVLINFSVTQSFRATVMMPTANGMASGDISFARHKGLRAVLRLPNGLTNELAFIKQDVYFHSGTSSWMNLRDTDEGHRLVLLFVSALSLAPSSTNALISEQARIVSITDDPAGCKRYTFTQNGGDGERQTSYLCVKNELPLLMGTVTPDGPIETHYRDYNTTIEIKNPLRP